MSDLIDSQATLQLRFGELLQRADDLAIQFSQARPYPHIVIDDFLPPGLAGQLVQDFPAASAALWQRLPTDDQRHKLASSKECDFPESIRRVIHELNSAACLTLLERITGIANLVCDPKLVGGGLHQIERGGRLNVHIDYSHHPGTNLSRRLNLIVYLNPDWKEEYGGHFELWDTTMSKCHQRIAPLFNRCVVFATSNISYHGHPEPLACPEGMTRRSIALYYYSNGRPEELGPVLEHNTIFRSRPGERVSWGTRFVRWGSSGLMKDLMPPVLHRWLRNAWIRGGTKQS